MCEAADGLNGGSVRAHGSESGRVLIVDDDAIIRLYFTRVMGLSGLPVDGADSIRQALGLLRRTVYKLILLDGHLPDGHGSEIARYVQQDARSLSTSIVAISSDDSPSHVQMMANAGVSRFFVKPIRAEQIMQLVKAVKNDAGIRLNESA